MASIRSGRDPFNGGNYPDKAGTAMHEKMWLRSWNNRTYLWYSEVADLDPTNYSISAYFNLLKTKAVTDSGVAKDQFHFTENTAEYQQQSQSGVSSGYGIEWSVVSTSAPRSFTVAYTEPNSPAALAGVKRGDFLLEVIFLSWIESSALRLLPNSNAAAMEMALASPIPLNCMSWDTDIFPNVFKLFSEEAKMRWHNCTALSFREPEPIKIASNSESDKVDLPFRRNFSRGRSSSAHWLIGVYIKFYFGVYENKVT